MAKLWYKSPGPHEVEGIKLEWKVFEDADDEKAAADGWATTIYEARDIAQAASKPVEPQAPAAPPVEAPRRGRPPANKG